MVIGSILVVAMFSATGLIIALDLNHTHPWDGMSCTEMLDFNATDEHHTMNEKLHLEFHIHYDGECN